jgi:hypothetical protein
MVLQRIRRAAAVLALTATLALAAPAHAAGWEDLAVGPRWLEAAPNWIASLWLVIGDVIGLKPAVEKCSSGMNPDGLCSGAASPLQPPTASSSGGSGSGG